MWDDLFNSLVNADLEFVLYRVAGSPVLAAHMDEVRAKMKTLFACRDGSSLAKAMNEEWLPRMAAVDPDFDVNQSVWGWKVRSRFDGELHRIKWEGNGSYAPEYLYLPSDFVEWNPQYKSYKIELTSNREKFGKDHIRIIPYQNSLKGNLSGFQRQSDGQVKVSIQGNREELGNKGTPKPDDLSLWCS